MRLKTDVSHGLLTADFIEHSLEVFDRNKRFKKSNVVLNIALCHQARDLEIISIFLMHASICFRNNLTVYLQMTRSTAW